MLLLPLYLAACATDVPAPSHEPLLRLGASENRLPAPCVGLGFVDRDLVVGTAYGLVDIPDRGARRIDPDPGGAGDVLGSGQPFALSPDGSRAAIGQPDGTIRVITRGGGAVKVLEGDGRVVALAWLPDGRLVSTLASGWPHGKARTEEVSVWPDTLASAKRFTPEHCRVDLVVRPFGSNVLTQCGVGPVKVLDLETHELEPLSSPVGNPSDVWASADGTRVIVSAWPRSSSWRVGESAPEATFDGYLEAGSVAGDTGVVGVAGSVRVVRGADVVHDLQFPEARVTAVAATSDGSRIAACSGHSVYVWDGVIGALRVSPPPGNAFGAQVVAVAADGRHAATADVWDVVIWTLPAGVQRARFRAVNVRDLMLDGERVYARADDGTRAWTLDGEEVEVEVEPAFPPAQESLRPPDALDVDLQGELGITGYADGTASVWDRASLVGH